MLSDLLNFDSVFSFEQAKIKWEDGVKVLLFKLDSISKHISEIEAALNNLLTHKCDPDLVVANVKTLSILNIEEN